MKRDTAIQLAAAGVLAVAATASGMLMPRMIDNSERHALKYTDVTVEGAPPIVAIGTAIGALREELAALVEQACGGGDAAGA